MEYIKKYWIGIIIAFGVSLFIKPAFCFLILGTLLLYLGITSVLFQIKIQKKGIECNGKILSFTTSRRGNTTPIIEFTPFTGNTIIEEPFIYTSLDLGSISFNDENVKKEVLIVYDPDNPKRFIVADENGFNYIVLVFVLLVGLVFITVSICNLLGYIQIGQ
jgi:hypothetical protein